MALSRTVGTFLGDSAATVTLRAEIELAARSDAKVLISGEPGVGKGLVAQLIHQLSRRRDAPFIRVDCHSRGVPTVLLESELFGHTRGSLPGAVRDYQGVIREAHHGIVFFDDVGEMVPRLQDLLSQFLETRQLPMIGGRTDVVDVRVVAASARDLAAQAIDGQFRLDLLYRLNVIRIDVPPLRERRHDIPALVAYFVDVWAQKHNVTVPVLSSDAMTALQTSDWPGNVRQLHAAVNRIVEGSVTE
jgi:DNA-binding NtrC family response regulator